MHPITESPRIVHPIREQLPRPVWRYRDQGDGTYQVLRRGRHVADVRPSLAGGLSLFSVASPELEIAWAGSLFAMKTLAPEALAAQETAEPDTYVWARLHLHKIELYTRPLDVSLSA